MEENKPIHATLHLFFRGVHLRPHGECCSQWRGSGGREGETIQDLEGTSNGRALNVS